MANESELAVPTTPKKLAPLTEKTIVPAKGLKPYLDAMIPQIRDALPASMKSSAEHFARTLMTEAGKNYDLSICTAPSLLGSLMTAAQLGLEVGSHLGQGYLVPYNNSKIGLKECQLQIGYRGYAVLAHRSQQVKALYAHIVYSNDQFSIQLGSSPSVEHVPHMAGKRGDPVGCYAVLETMLGGKDIEWMGWDEIMFHKNKYSKGGDGPKSGWGSSPTEMARKTVFRRIVKRAPVSLELAAAAGLDDLHEDDRPQNNRYALADASPDLAELTPDEPEPSEKAATIAGNIGRKPGGNQDVPS